MLHLSNFSIRMLFWIVRGFEFLWAFIKMRSSTFTVTKGIYTLFIIILYVNWWIYLIKSSISISIRMGKCFRHPHAKSFSRQTSGYGYEPNDAYKIEIWYHFKRLIFKYRLLSTWEVSLKVRAQWHVPFDLITQHIVDRQPFHIHLSIPFGEKPAQNIWTKNKIFEFISILGFQ